MKYIPADKLIAEIKIIQQSLENRDVRLNSVKKIRTECSIEFCKCIIDVIDSLQQEQQDEQPEYGYLSTKYIHGKKSIWSVGDVLAYYICTSNEEGEYTHGKIVNVEFDDEEGWVYTFEDEGVLDEQSLVEHKFYKKS